MAISFQQALGVHEQALTLRTKRAEVLANNLANVDTPGFKARDINFLDVLREQAGKSSSGDLAMSGTRANHLNVQGSSSGMQPTLQYRIHHQASLDNNTVDAHAEQAEFSRNALDFQASFRFLDGKFKGLMTALRGE